jgi:hypothetical protein
VIACHISELRRRVGRRLVADWQAEHGAFTVDELEAARVETAAADAEAFNLSGPAAARAFRSSMTPVCCWRSTANASADVGDSPSGG